VWVISWWRLGWFSLTRTAIAATVWSRAGKEGTLGETRTVRKGLRFFRRYR